MSATIEEQKKSEDTVKCTKCDQEFNPNTHGTIGPFVFLQKVVYICPNC